MSFLLVYSLTLSTYVYSGIRKKLEVQPPVLPELEISPRKLRVSLFFQFFSRLFQIFCFSFSDFLFISNSFKFDKILRNYTMDIEKKM